MSDGLALRLAEAKERVARMTDAERAEMYEAQRQSWAKAFQPCEHGVVDFEQCPKCRQPEGKSDE